MCTEGCSDETDRLAGVPPALRSRFRNVPGDAASEQVLARTAADDELLAGLRRGDELAFQALAIRHNHAMLAIANAFVPTRAVAEDVVLDAWRTLLEDLDRLAGPSLKLAIGRIVVDVARSRAGGDADHVGPAALQPEGKEAAVAPERFRGPDAAFPGHWRRYPADWRSLPEGMPGDDETTGVVRRALEELPPAMKVVVSLRDVDGWTAEEVCAGLELSASAERLLLHRGRSRVRAALERHFDD